MARGISLANKCLLLFGAAIVLIVLAALVVPWIRLGRIVDEAQLESSRQIADLWTQRRVVDADRYGLAGSSPEEPTSAPRDLQIRWWEYEKWTNTQFAGGFLKSAQDTLVEREGGVRGTSEHSDASWDEEDRVYRYARLVVNATGEPLGVVVVNRRSTSAGDQLLVNRVYMLIAGSIAGSMAVLVFYLITKRLILSPVRTLTQTADRVREGSLEIRSELKTGDEFEQLSDAFNSMLANLSEQHQLLRGINRSLDMRLNELEQRNSELHESARLKGEFLASISHELRTPLNSIIGFAEILQDIATKDAESGHDPISPDQLAKRQRYLDNIVSAGRTLLQMINELLEMAKIEAGNIELHTQRVNVAETCEALMALIKPLADRKSLNLSLQLQASREEGFTTEPKHADLPLIETDQQKFHHVVFNFLSNAVKFTPDEGDVTLRADRVFGGDGEPRLRVSVLDTGPGIPADQQQFIFEKFSQIDAGHTRSHQGTGLGLAIAKEFAELLQGEIQLVSEVGRGSMFSLVVPLSITTPTEPEPPARLVERVSGPS